MKVFKIEIENYRLLKSFSMDLEKELSLVIGKNNTGKTSILSALDKFLSQSDRNKFSFDDFNIEFKKELKSNIDSEDAFEEEDYKRIGVRLRLFIEYTETDNLTNVSRVMMDLDPDNNVIVIGFEYTMDYVGYRRIRKDYKEFDKKENEKKQAKQDDYTIKSAYEFLRLHQSEYFKVRKYSLEYNITTKLVNENTSIDLDIEKISIADIVNFKFISAKRDVTNKEIDKTLSSQTSRIYRRTEASDEQNIAVEDFKDKLSETDSHLTGIYKTLFDGIVKKVCDFGGVKINESEIEIISTLQHRELLEGNTTVVYKHDADSHLPEHYNGLGYMNLISMIFEIEILVHEFKKEKDKKPADINLLFIEEPEAHTHPQMQYIFIKNIKKLLGQGIKREDGEQRELQYIITTHSSHIVSDSDFNDIKYLKRDEPNSVISKNIRDLEKQYSNAGEGKNFRFLKQYLTLNRAELFFADKAVFVEGDTERILLPAMMKKIDEEFPENPMLSQNISIIEVGNYANVFERFINFVGIKSLIITDLDAVKRDFIRNSNGTIKTSATGKQRMADYSCPVLEGEKTTNPTLNFFFTAIPFNQLRSSNFEEKRFKKGSSWIVDQNGHVQIAFQTEENIYQGRSFEDSFFSIDRNRQFIKANRSKFKGLKNLKLFYDLTKNPFELAQQCIDSKGTFALDILICSNEELSNWEIPTYIKEGLLWLKID